MSAPSLAVTQKAYFAGGCFWCMEAAFEKVPGVSEVLSGYMDGADQKPTYKTYAKSGHVEAIEVQYDPRKVSYAQLLNTFWKNIDPTDPDGQFVDRGPQYRAVIFYQNETEKDQAEQSKKALSDSKRFAKPVVTEIKKASTFYPAEKGHQNYYTNNPGLYWWYTSGSGRKEFFQKHWNKMSTPQNNPTYAKPSDAELRKKLTPLQYRVTQQGATEPPHKNEYNLLMEPGIYVDIVSGEPLFSSKDKFISKSGWPSFSRPLVPENIIEKGRWFRSGKEVRSKHADSHLGDVFSGEDTETGLRYCINSAALRFIPANELQKEGYGAFANSISNN